MMKSWEKFDFHSNCSDGKKGKVHMFLTTHWYISVVTATIGLFNSMNDTSCPYVQYGSQTLNIAKHVKGKLG